jgi:hypothetical protein
MTMTRAAAARLFGVTLLVAALTALAAPIMASAAATPKTSADPDRPYYVASVTGIEPAVPGLAVVVHGGGESITLTNRTGSTVKVIGYSGEDYLRITPIRVDENSNSLTAVLNSSDGGRAGLPKKFADPAQAKALPVKWHQVGTTNTVTWHDYRTRWNAGERPPIVREQPHSRHQVFAWAIQLSVNNRPALVRGDVTWTGSPRFGSPALVALVVGGLAVALAVLVAVITIRRRIHKVPPDSAPLIESSIPFTVERS